MKCAFALVAVASLVAAGCAESNPVVKTASASPNGLSDESSSASTSAGAPTIDSEVKQASAAQEETAKEGVEIGDAGPAWENLMGADDKKHSLKDLADAKAVAVVFSCNTCPVVVAYEDRMNQLAKDYKEKGVEFVAINVNNNEGNKLPAMKERAAEKGFVFQYLYDPSQQIARDYAATCTPHAFLLDGERKIVYMGAIDDNQKESGVSQHYLREAIDATLAGETPETAETKQFGCGIRYE